jgi:hypothetical protein
MRIALTAALAPILAELAQARAEVEELTAKWKDALSATNHNYGMFAAEFQKREAAEADARELREALTSLFERIHQDSEVAWVHDNIRAILSTPPSAPSGEAYRHSTHHVHRGAESLPCYCAATSDHPIGQESGNA